MDYRVSYEHSLKNAPDEFIVHVPSQLVEDIPANIPRALLPEYITDLILKRSSRSGKSGISGFSDAGEQLAAGWEHGGLEVCVVKRQSRAAVAGPVCDVRLQPANR